VPRNVDPCTDVRRETFSRIMLRICSPWRSRAESPDYQPLLDTYYSARVP
jgi:hypothetical protein